MPKYVCNYPACYAAISKGRYCAKHKKAAREYDKHRPPSSQRLYDAKWRRIRNDHLLEEPFCRSCGSIANEVDHIVPHRMDEDLFFDRENLQSLCKSCHSRKTRAEMNA